MKGRESGMPDDAYWETFFNPRCILERMDCVVPCGDVVEFGCGYRGTNREVTLSSEANPRRRRSVIWG